MNNFHRKIKADSNLRNFYLEYLEEELEKAYAFISKEEDVNGLLRAQGRLKTLQSMKARANVKSD